MKQLLTNLVDGLPVYHSFRNGMVAKRQLRQYEQWQQAGKPVPAPHRAKQLALKNAAQQFGLRVLVETGTFRGDMIQAMRNDFDRIYSIELSELYYRKALRRFAGDNSIVLVHGDSGVEIQRIVNELGEPALFWLDGHYSGGDTARGDEDTPVLAELKHVLTADVAHVAVVDDARCFGVDAGYPDLDTLTGFVKQIRPDVAVSVEDDIIRVLPPVTQLRAAA